MSRVLSSDGAGNIHFGAIVWRSGDGSPSVRCGAKAPEGTGDEVFQKLKQILSAETIKI